MKEKLLFAMQIGGLMMLKGRTQQPILNALLLYRQFNTFENTLLELDFKSLLITLPLLVW